MSRGRRAGLALLVLAVLLLGALDSRVQRDRRNELFDFYQHLVPRQRLNDGVVVVAIDDASLQAMGQWPWPRSKMAELVDRIAAEHPAAIAIDALFAEPDRLSPKQQGLLLLKAGYSGLAGALDSLPDYDAQFAAALHRAPVVLGVGALAEDAGLRSGTPYRAPLLQSGADPAPFAPAYPASLRSIEIIDAAAAGHGVLPMASQDGVVRRIATLARLGPDLLPSLPVETLRLAAHEAALRVDTGPGGIRALRVAGRSIATEADGEWWLHFSDARERPHLAVADLLQGKAPPGVLSGRIALIGYTALGWQDVVVTPRGPMPGVDVIAEAMDNVIDGRLLGRPRWSRGAEAAVLLALSLLMVLLVPWLRPLHAAGIFLLSLAALLAFGLLLFRWQGWLIDVANPAIGATFVFAVMLALSLNDTRAQRSRLRQALQESHVATARLEGELDAARRIQMGMLPEPRQVLRQETRVEVAARMLPARSVGGDLYDFFLLDESHLFIVVGDVSGKGLPASLFMALSKALTKGAALRSGADPGRTLREAGAAISEENPELLFVTVLAAVLDLGSGRLDWCSAGHEPPWLLPASAAAPRRLPAAGGPPLCVIDGFDYRSQSLQLQPGDALCLLTDGLGDAQNRAGEFYGQARIGAAIGRFRNGESAPYIVESLLADSLAFSEGAEQADDITILALRWHGAAREAPQSIEAKTARM
ncbi:MAG TPA: CHASE2 domain-containing protein [Nevskia sp.]|nr:CHASE2 domain-containing protein [Nevskia sp.]